MDFMKVAAAIILAICGLTYWAESRADYILQLVIERGNQPEIIQVDRYKHRNQCEMVLAQYRLGKAVYGDQLQRPIERGGCVSCEEFAELCQEGI